MAELIENVSDTAFWIAYYRGVETRRADALFKDPLADELAGEQGKRIAETMPGGFLTEWVVAIRTRVIDEFIQEAIAEGIDCVLNLGAGLDTRPYRMDLPKAFLWVEADHPRMIEFKENRLKGEKPRCDLERVSVDLTNSVERQKFFAGIDARGRKVLVLTEGLVVYLSVEEAGSLADDLKAMRSVRYWVVDYLSAEAMKFREKSEISRRTKNAPFRFNPANWFGFFLEHGWQVKEMRYFSEEGKRLKRRPRIPLPMLAAVIVRRMFSSRERRENLKKMAGYAMLEPLRVAEGRPTI
jgi:methyltransferase (TIGR00027 family)